MSSLADRKRKLSAQAKASSLRKVPTKMPYESWAQVTNSVMKNTGNALTQNLNRLAPGALGLGMAKSGASILSNTLADEVNYPPL